MPPRQRGQVHFCGHCGLTSGGRRVFAEDMWRGRWYCGDVCSRAAGDRTRCDNWDCGCSAYSKLLRVLRGVLVGKDRLKYELERQTRRRNPQADFAVDMDALNLPYNQAMHLNLAIGGDVDDRLDPDSELRESSIRAELRADAVAEAASQSAMVDAVAVIALHNENKRRRLDNSSNLESMRLKLERKAMQYEDLMSDKLRSS